MRAQIFTSLLAALATASPLLQRDVEPCELVAEEISNQDKAPYRVDPNNALACLRSVPVDKDNDLLAIRAFKSFAEIESNLAYLKHPTPGTLYPATDILGRLDKILKDLEDDVYTNEYDLQFDVWATASDAYDYHFNYDIDIVHVFKWRRAAQLISVSPDGISLPSIYIYSDLGNMDTASPVSTINGIDVETFLNDYAALLPYGHDPDANYNALFWNAPATNSGDGNPNGTFAGGARPQLETVIKFVNGSTVKIDTYATTREDFDGVTDGTTFFSKYCQDADVESDENVPDETVPTTLEEETEEDAPPLNEFAPLSTNGPSKPRTNYYPTALVATDDNTMFGYLPEDIPDLAVLQLGSFLPKSNAQFQNNVRALLATAQDQNRTKLLIDLRGNGGGKIFLGYDTFRQIFPTIYPYGGSTLRSPPIVREITESISEYIKATPDRSQWPKNVSWSSTTAFNAYAFLDTNNDRFTLSETFYGPYSYYNDNFTAIERHNIASAAQTGSIDVYGYGNNTNPIPQVFKPENIIILQDGMCGSTCSIFSEFMKSQGNVKTIVAGGRKQNGTMQGVGGTKGSQVISLAYMEIIAAAAEVAVDDTHRADLEASLVDFNEGHSLLAGRTDGGERIRINFRNQIRQGDSSKTALQYVYEAANCRFFYTPSMLHKQVEVWDHVYDLNWGNGTCVRGSANHPSSQTGNATSYINSPAPDHAKYVPSKPKSSSPSSKPSTSVKASSARSSRTRHASSANATGASKSFSAATGAKSHSASSKHAPSRSVKSSSATTTSSKTSATSSSTSSKDDTSPNGKSSSTSSTTTCTDTKYSVTSSAVTKSSASSYNGTPSSASVSSTTSCTETKTSATSKATSKTSAPPYNGPSTSSSATSTTTCTETKTSATSSKTSKTTALLYDGPSSSSPYTTTTTPLSVSTPTGNQTSPSPYSAQLSSSTSVSSATSATSNGVTPYDSQPSSPAKTSALSATTCECKVMTIVYEVVETPKPESW